MNTLFSLPVIFSLAFALVIWPQPSRTLQTPDEHRPRDGPPSWWAKLQGSTSNHVDPLSRASELRLVAACLNAGLSPMTAAEAVASTSDLPAWGRLATMLSVGMTPHVAWSEMATVPGCEELVIVARNASRSGAAMSQGCIRIAEQLEQQAHDLAVARAEKASVMIAAPLSLCFLPAFIVLGLVPLIFNLGLSVL